MSFTLDKLAQALRGMPRDAPMLIQLPDGSLAEIDHVEPAHVIARGDALEVSTSSSGTKYSLVLVPKLEQ